MNFDDRHLLQLSLWGVYPIVSHRPSEILVNEYCNADKQTFWLEAMVNLELKWNPPLAHSYNYFESNMIPPEIIEATLTNPHHTSAIVALLDQYARDPTGGREGLSPFAKSHLPDELAKRTTAHVVLAFVDGEPAGLAICFEGFSTFQCRPLLNIHDLIVSTNHRGKGLSKLLLKKTEEIARRLGCCKLTLEVLEENSIARNAYRSFGFHGYELDPAMGNALFLEMKL